jgi:hypothetical protein
VPVANPNIDYLDDMLFGPEQSGEEQVDAYIKEIEQEQRNEEIAQSYIDSEPESTPQKKSIESSAELKDIPDTANRMFYPEELEEPKKKTYIMKQGNQQIRKQSG